MLAELLCDEKTRDKLGEAGLTEVAAHLWAQDCQSCGRALGPGPPALCVDELSWVVTAGLHHPGCRPPGWNDSSLIIGSSRGVLTWQACAFLLPLVVDRRDTPRPALLVNPGLEQITLKPGEGTWHVGYDDGFEQLGLLPPGPQMIATSPVAGATAC